MGRSLLCAGVHLVAVGEGKSGFCETFSDMRVHVDDADAIPAEAFQMAKYMIGVTEAGDASVNLQWEKTLEKVDGAILVTKNVSKDFRAAVMRSPNKVIVHATVTGFAICLLDTMQDR